MANKKPAAEPKLGSLELTEQLIRERAYYFYLARGSQDGHHLEDWLKAEAEISGRKPGESGSPARKARKATAA